MNAITYTARPIGWATCKALGLIWPGCRTTRLNGFQLVDVPTPELPGDDWVRVRTLLGGICGSDVMIARQKQPPDSLLQGYTSQPILLGHENLAVVEAVGANVDESWIGRRVCVEPTLGCRVRGTAPMCPRCQAGEFGACENFSGALGGSANLPAGTSIGYNNRTGGSWSEQFVAHVSQLEPVPDALSDEVAILTDPIACSLHGVLRARLGEAQTVLVYGVGLLGLGTIACLRAVGFKGRIDAVVRSKRQAEQARRYGADDGVVLPTGRAERFAEVARRTDATVQVVRFGNRMLSGGYDVVFDCVGTRQSVTECMKWTRARGQIVMVGTLQTGKLDLTPLWFRELEIVGAYGRQIEHVAGRDASTYRLVLDWLADGTLSAEGMLTHTFRQADWRKALDVALHKSRHGAMKVAFDFRDG